MSQRTLFLAVLGALIACGTDMNRLPSECLAGAGGVGGSGASGAEQVLLVGSSTTVTLSVTPLVDCDAPVKATGAQTSVVGPDNLPVPSTQANLITPTGVGGLLAPYSVDVTFTPTQAGSYHLVAKFDPNLGVAQVDLRAAYDGSVLPILSSYSANTLTGCELYAVTTNGTLLCTNSDRQIAAFRGGAKLGEVPGDLMAVRGNAVWVATDSSSTLNLFTDTGVGMLVPQSPDDFHVSSFINQMIPGDDGVVVMMSLGLALVSPVDGGFAQTRTWDDVQGAFAGARKGNDVIIATSQTFMTSVDGGAFEPAGDQSDSLNCVGYGSEGLWFVENTRHELRLYSAGGRAPVATLAGVGFGSWAAPAFPIQYGMLPYTVDTLGSSGRTYTPTWDATAHELFLRTWSNDGTLPTATADWLVLPNPAGGIIVKRVNAP